MMSQRHQLIFPQPQASFFIHSMHENNIELMHHITEWFNRGLPAVYARQLEQESAHLNLGLPVLLANKKYRVGLVLPKCSVQRTEQLPKLVDVADLLARKAGKQSALLFSTQERVTFKCVSVFGSFLFEYLTGQPFVREDSDLDVLIDYKQQSLTELRCLLVTLETKLSRAIDGELRFRNLGDVALKELVDTSSNQLLFKNSHEAGLISRHDLYAQYPNLLAL